MAATPDLHCLNDRTSHHDKKNLNPASRETLNLQDGWDWRKAKARYRSGTRMEGNVAVRHCGRPTEPAAGRDQSMAKVLVNSFH